MRKRALVAWESHLRDGSERKGRDGRGGGDALEGADGALGCMMAEGIFNRGYCGLGANKHSHNTIVTTGPCFNGSSPNVTPATLASVLLPGSGIVVALSGWMARWHSASIVTRLQ